MIRENNAEAGAAGESPSWVKKAGIERCDGSLGPVMLLRENLTRPKGVVRIQAVQDKVNRQCKSLALYQYQTCPFCIKVRQEMSRLSLNIERIDAQPEGPHRQALLKGGGQAKVSCLRITDKAGRSQWLYDSDKIVAYLRERFAAA